MVWVGELIVKVTMNAPAKINLFLHVTGKRADGYHLLQSAFSFIDLHDILQLESSDVFRFSVSGEFAGILSTEDNNTVLRAYKALSGYVGDLPPVAITLEKHIPTAAGLGGGSADAATTLKALNQLFELKIPTRKLAEIGLGIGADVPACVYAPSPLWVEGIGEQCRNIEVDAASEGAHLLVVNPLRKLPTAQAFGIGFEFYEDLINAPPQHISMDWLKEHTTNQLTQNAIEICPEIQKVLSILEETQPELARMSGSGATCFAVYQSEEQSRSAKLHAQKAQPDWWVREVRLLSATH